MRKILLYTILFGIGAVAGMLLSRSFHASERVEVISSDTLYVRDTNIYNFPDMVSEITIPEETIIINDSIIVIDDSIRVLPVQQRHYKGEDYEAWVSGYRPRLDSLYVFPQTRYVTGTIFVDSRKRWGIGIQAGYGVALSGGKPVLSPYIGVGISYDLIRF